MNYNIYLKCLWAVYAWLVIGCQIVHLGHLKQRILVPALAHFRKKLGDFFSALSQLLSMIRSNCLLLINILFTFLVLFLYCFLLIMWLDTMIWRKVAWRFLIFCGMWKRWRDIRLTEWSVWDHDLMDMDACFWNRVVLVSLRNG